MNEESSTRVEPPAPPATESTLTPSSPPVAESTAMPPASPPPEPPAPARRRQGLPSWLPYLALAVIPAAIVGIAVYALTGSDNSNNNVAGVLDGFFRQGSSQENVESVAGRTPPGFPEDFPIYEGAEIYGGYKILAEDGSDLTYITVIGSDDPLDDVYDFYVESLGDDPWQVEGAQSASEFTGVRFSRPDDADVGGLVAISRSDLDKRTTVIISYQDLTPDSADRPNGRSFALGATKPLPPNFPTDIPIYEGKSGGDSVVTDTAFQRAPGGSSYAVSFLTKDSQDDVISAYRGEFEKKGWQVVDSESGDSGFQLGIDFADGPSRLVQGTVLADVFDGDASYTRVDLLVQVSSSRRGGN